jgi:uncharacterized protein
MDLSEALANLNVGRYAAWQSKHSSKNAKQAALAFDGDVYGGLRAPTLSGEQLDWAQQNIRILSGLYGVLRPLDFMQPYRLEMGTSLTVGKTKNLYQFWGAQIAEYLNGEITAHKTPVVVNLASEEYFKAVDTKTLKARVIHCVFEDYKNGQYKIISFNAKRARGLMARFAIERKIDTVKKLEGFSAEGFAFDASASRHDRLVFRRKEKT